MICFFYLTDRPAKATWLAADEKAWLENEMQKEKRTLAQHRSFSVLETLVNWRVLALAAMPIHLDCLAGALRACKGRGRRDPDLCGVDPAEADRVPTGLTSRRAPPIGIFSKSAGSPDWQAVKRACQAAWSTSPRLLCGRPRVSEPILLG